MNVHSSIIYNSQRKVDTIQPSTKWINKMWHAHTMEYYLPIKRDKVLISATMWMNLETLCLVKEAIHKRPVLYGSFYRKCSE